MKRLMVLIFAVFAMAGTAFASSGIDKLLQSDPAPVGVVFEVVQGDKNALAWALPSIEEHSAKLREAFPDIKIAVVTHGNEQFSLVTSETGKASQKIKSLAQKLDASGTPVHVCGGHADMRGVSREAFPSYIDVAPSGPAKLTEYRNQGYKVVILRKN